MFLKNKNEQNKMIFNPFGCVCSLFQNEVKDAKNKCFKTSVWRKPYTELKALWIFADLSFTLKMKHLYTNDRCMPCTELKTV